MKRILLVLGLAATAGLAACEDGGLPGAGGPAAAPGSQFVGMSTTRLVACAGEPDEKRADVQQGPTEYWTYVRGEGQQVCRAQFDIRQGHVAAARFAGAGLTPLTDLAVCEPVIGTC